MSNPLPLAVQLDQADQQLRQLLARLDGRANSQADVQALTAAVQRYQQAVVACLPHGPVDVRQLTPAQLLAYREADPVYRLGFVRGHRRGVEQAGEAPEQALRLYAHHAALPAPTQPAPPSHEVLVRQVTAFLDHLRLRYTAGYQYPAFRPAA